MALLERVATLVRANLNDLIDKAEDPEKLIKQVILDMQNQLLQVKTQVAIAIADQHLLEKKQTENERKGDRLGSQGRTGGGQEAGRPGAGGAGAVAEFPANGRQLRQQAADQTVQVENLKTALRKLEQKLAEAQAKSDVLIAQHRRARAATKATDAQFASGNHTTAATFERMQDKVRHSEAVSQAKTELLKDDVDDQLAALEKQDQIDKMLAEMKAKRG
jgi:phage shock protein A